MLIRDIFLYEQDSTDINMNLESQDCFLGDQGDI